MLLYVSQLMVTEVQEQNKSVTIQISQTLPLSLMQNNLNNHPSYKYLLNFIYSPLFANMYRGKKRNVINYRNHVICERDYLRKITKEKHKNGRFFKGKHGVVD